MPIVSFEVRQESLEYQLGWHVSCLDSSGKDVPGSPREFPSVFRFLTPLQRTIGRESFTTFVRMLEDRNAAELQYVSVSASTLSQMGFNTPLADVETVSSRIQ